MKVKNLDKNANVTLKALKLEFETFGPMSQPVLKKLCVGKPKLKRQAQPKLRFQNKIFIIVPSPSAAKDYYIQKNTKMHLRALFNVWKKNLIRIQLEKKSFFKRGFFHGNVFRKDFFPLFCKFFNFRKHPKIYFIP